jgi:hypothetical protein
LPLGIVATHTAHLEAQNLRMQTVNQDGMERGVSVVSY